MAEKGNVKKYNRRKVIVEIAESVWLIMFLGHIMYRGWSLEMREFLSGFASSPWIVNGLYLVAFFFLIKAILLPLDYYSGYHVEHTFGLSTENFASWILDELKELALSIVFGLLVGEIVYGLIRAFPTLWWLIASFVLSALCIVLTNLAPVLLMPIFFRFQRLRDKDLEARILKLTDRARTKINGVFEMNLSKKTRAANAALAGIGRTRRIILSDTLLKEYNHEEIESIMAHELGHQVYNHIWKGILVQGMLITVLFFLLAHGLNKGVLWFHLQGIHDIAGLPYLVLITILFSFIFLPLVNLYMRTMEYQADQYGVSITGNRESFISALEKLSQQNLCDRKPNAVVEFLFYNHPSIAKRIGRLTDG
ncbi:MAG: M48 family metallopeptidase [bacterium]